MISPSRGRSRVLAISFVSLFVAACDSGSPTRPASSAAVPGGRPVPDGRPVPAAASSPAVPAAPAASSAPLSPASAGPARVACDNRAIESTCADYWNGATASDAKGTCDGKVLESACPKDNAIGTCTVVVKDGRKLTNTYYAGGPRTWNAESAKARCTDGEWKKL